MTDATRKPEKYRDVEIRAPRGNTLTAKSWLTEAPLRMLMNNLDPEVAENPKELVVYGGIGRAARNWECYDKIVESLTNLNDDETLLVQSGKPVGVFKTHSNAPRVLIANSNLVPHWATWEHFNELDAKGLAMYGQMTAGSWIYIGSQGIVQGTYETFVEAGRQHYDSNLKGRWVLTAGLGGMGGAQPLAATLAGACSLNIECQQVSIDFRLKTRYVDEQAKDLDDALAADVDPAAGGHLAVHGQALGVEFVEVLPTGPVRYQVGVGDQYARGVAVGLEHAHRLAGLHQQGFVVIQVGQAFDDLVVALPVARRAANATVDHQFLGVLGHFRVEVVHQHAQRRFSQPALGGQRVTARGTDFNVTVFFGFAGSVGHSKNSSAINPDQPGQWAAIQRTLR